MSKSGLLFAEGGCLPLQLLSCSHKEYNLVVDGRTLKMGKLKLVTFKKILVLMENKKLVYSFEIECGVTVLNLWSKDTQTWFFHG